MKYLSSATPSLSTQQIVTFAGDFEAYKKQSYPILILSKGGKMKYWKIILAFVSILKTVRNYFWTFSQDIGFLKGLEFKKQIFLFWNYT